MSLKHDGSTMKGKDSFLLIVCPFLILTSQSDVTALTSQHWRMLIIIAYYQSNSNSDIFFYTSIFYIVLVPCYGCWRSWWKLSVDGLHATSRQPCWNLKVGCKSSTLDYMESRQDLFTYKNDLRTNVYK